MPPEDWIVVAQIPAIISQEQFEVIQEKLKHNQSIASRNNKAHQYLLRAMVSCGLCHLACTGRTTDTGHAYYACNGKRPLLQSLRTEKCPSRFLPVRQLDELVWADLCEVLLHPECLASALQRTQGGQWLPQELQARRENLRKAHVSVEHQLERLTDAYLASVVPLEEYKRRRRGLDGLASKLRQLEASANKHVELAGITQSMEEFCQQVRSGLEQASFEQKRQLIELLIDCVVVTNEEVEIRYVIPTSASSEQTRFCHLRSNYFDDAYNLLQRRNPLQEGNQFSQSFSTMGNATRGHLATSINNHHDIVMSVSPVQSGIPHDIPPFSNEGYPGPLCPYTSVLEARPSHGQSGPGTRQGRAIFFNRSSREKKQVFPWSPQYPKYNPAEVLTQEGLA